MTSANPRLLAIRRSLENCDTPFSRRARMTEWIDFPARMHRGHRIPGTTISKAELEKSKRVLRLWVAVYGSDRTPEFDAKFQAAYEAAIEMYPYTEEEKKATAEYRARRARESAAYHSRRA